LEVSTIVLHITCRNKQRAGEQLIGGAGRYHDQGLTRGLSIALA